MEIKYAVYRLQQIKNQDGSSLTVLGTFLGKYDTEEQAIGSLVNSPRSSYVDCTIIKIYNNNNPILSAQQFDSGVFSNS